MSSRSTPGSASGKSSAISPGPNARAAGAVQPYRGARRFEGRHALREEAAGEARQHVAGAGGGQRRRQVEADRGAPVGRRDDAVGALEDDDRVQRRGGGAGPRELARRAEDFRAAAEQPGELAFVRRDDRRAAAARAMRAARPAASPAKLVSASASSTIARAAALGSVSAAATSARVASPTPAPGPRRTALRLGSASSAANPASPSNGATITAVEWAALTSDRVGRAGERDEPCARRAARARAASRAAPVRCAGPESDERRAARIFVRSRARAAAARRRQIAGALTKARGAIAASALGAMPISASARRPHNARPGSRRWPGLRRKKVTRGARLDRRAAHRAGFAVDAGGNVDAEHRACRRARTR